MTNSAKYFEQLDAWKASYKALSQDIRDLKHQRKSLLSSYNPNAAWKVEMKRNEARDMMEQRKVLKERARAHWAAETERLDTLELA